MLDPRVRQGLLEFHLIRMRDQDFQRAMRFMALLQLMVALAVVVLMLYLRPP